MGNCSVRSEEKIPLSPSTSRRVLGSCDPVDARTGGCSKEKPTWLAAGLDDKRADCISIGQLLTGLLYSWQRHRWNEVSEQRRPDGRSGEPTRSQPRLPPPPPTPRTNPKNLIRQETVGPKRSWDFSPQHHLMKVVGVTFTAPETSHVINLLPGAKTTLVTWLYRSCSNLTRHQSLIVPLFRYLVGF